MAYKGRFKPKNISKYKGDASNIVYRSLWELHAFKWMDMNPDVILWSSEELIIPYKCKTDGELHRYFPDILVKFKTGDVVLIEIKPKHQTEPPKQSGNKKTSKLMMESMTYAKNHSKWEAAIKYCNERGWKFQIWTEDTLQAIGMKMISRKHPSRIAKRKP